MVIDEELVDDEKVIKDHIQSFYEKLFSETE